MVCTLHTTQNLVISLWHFAEDSKEMCQELYWTHTATVILIKPFV